MVYYVALAAFAVVGLSALAGCCYWNRSRLPPHSPPNEAVDDLREAIDDLTRSIADLRRDLQAVRQQPPGF